MRKKRKPTKGKLFNLKKWLTVPDAARHLSNVFEEEVSESDLLRIALDGHLKLSVYFVNHSTARCGKIVPYEDVEWVESKPTSFMMSGKGIPDKIKGNKKKIREYIDQFPPTTIMKSLNLDGERYLNLDDNVTTIRDVWDLSMIGNERLDVEHKYQMLTGGPEVTLQGLDGAFVEREDGRMMCQLQERFSVVDSSQESDKLNDFEKEIVAGGTITEDRLLEKKKERANRPYNHPGNYFPAGGLPRDSVLVVRTEALIDLHERLSQTDSRKYSPLDSRSETTYLNIIGAMLETFIHRSHGDVDFPSEAKLREFFGEKYAGFKGLTERTLAEKFAAAKRAINEDMD